MASTPTIVGLAHVQITVPVDGVDAARRFYCGLLGLREIPKPAPLRSRGGFWLQVSDQQVHVGVEDDVDRSATKAHIAYAVNGISAWRERLSAAGVAILDGVPLPDCERFEFRDPFGNRVELLEHRIAP